MKLIVPRPVCWKRTRMAAFGLSVLFTLPVGAQTILNPSFENRTLGDGLVGTANVVTDFSVSYTATGAEPQIGENLKVIIWGATSVPVTLHPSATDCTGSVGSWPVVR